MSTKIYFLSFCILFLGCSNKPQATPAPDGQPIAASIDGAARPNHQAQGTHFAIATQGNAATQIASEIIAKGGTLVDAAIATSFAISVERPQSTGIGGGGFFLYFEAKTGKAYAVDFRERAPLKATENMYLDASGKPDKEKSRNGILAVGVPGMILGMSEIHKRFGTLPMKDLIEPAAKLAEEGFPVYPELYSALKARETALAKDPAAKKVFLDENGKAWPVGHILVQKDLAHSLRLVEKEGSKAFYQGILARKISAFSQQKKGLITTQDLRKYQVKWREPLQENFAGYEVYSMPPPSSGGVHVMQFLNMLENDSWKREDFLSARAIHLGASALQSAFVDRARYLGDPDFVKVPVQGLIAKDYAEKRRKEFNETRARHADEVAPGKPAGYESLETTHFSMMDAEGNAVSSTQTVNGWMGAGIVVPGTGILLNNEMDDFSALAGTQNMFGAVGGKPDSIEPQKTPLSSMSPTILVQNHKPVMAVGAPGGTRIISCVAETIFNVVEFKLPLEQAVSSIRYHQQWRPDELIIDPPGPRADVLAKLKSMGYQVEIKPVGCKVMAVLREADKLQAVSDPRDIGTAWAQ